MAKLNIVSGNIFDYLDNKDLIVNSANQYMIYGSGVCGAIYKMADKDLLEELLAYEDIYKQPARKKCATLAILGIKDLIEK